MTKQKFTIIYGEVEKNLDSENGQLLGDVIAESDLPLEQPCAGLGTCGRCKVLVEKGGNRSGSDFKLPQTFY